MFQQPPTASKHALSSRRNGGLKGPVAGESNTVTEVSEKAGTKTRMKICLGEAATRAKIIKLQTKFLTV